MKALDPTAGQHHHHQTTTSISKLSLTQNTRDIKSLLRPHHQQRTSNLIRNHAQTKALDPIAGQHHHHQITTSISKLSLTQNTNDTKSLLRPHHP